MAGRWKVVVTGSRTWTDYALICSVLDGILARHPALTVIEGAAPDGADAMAHAWARRQLRSGGNVRGERHPADWDAPCRPECRPGHRRKRRDGSDFCPAAGHYRNKDKLAASGADECVAFIAECTDGSCRRARPHGSHGASDCAELAEEAGIETRRFQPWLAALWPDRGAAENAL